MKINHFLLLPIILIPLMIMPLLSGTYSSIRCGQYVVSLGATHYEVLRKCGAPDDVQVNTIERKVYDKNYALWDLNMRKKDEYRYCDDSAEEKHYSIITVEIQRLTYDFGPNRLIHILTFEDGLLVEIETGEYGSE